MNRIPQRVSLVAQTATILREEIQSGAWPRLLPGEHELCARMNVSRITLRAALDKLQREGLIRSSQGKRRQITKPGHRQGDGNKRVVLLTPFPLHELQPNALFWIDSLRQHLGEAGYLLDIHVARSVYGSGQGHSLKSLCETLRPAGWVLYLSTEEMQRWFSSQQLPCVITGSRHAGVELPSVDIAYRAVCRHAAGLFLARGHRFLVLLNPESGAAGDFESEQGFREAVAQSKHAGAQAAVVQHDGTVVGICQRLESLLGRTPRPTSFLVSRPGHVLTVMGHLMAHGLRFPQDAVLISRDDASFLSNMVPSIARYSSDPTAFARKISRIVLEMVRGGVVTASEHTIMPRFIPGETLGRDAR